MELEGRVAIVTGSSRGIGKAIAVAFAGEGANVVVTARTETAGDSEMPGTIHQTVAEIDTLSAGKALAVRCDLLQEEEIKSMVQKTVDEFGQIDILVNNAGDFTPTPNLAETLTEVWDRIMAVNIRAVFLCCKYVLPVMIARQRGSIINLGSESAEHTSRWFSAYAVSKAGMERFSLCLAREAEKHNIAVNSFRPGMIRTEGAEALSAINPEGMASMDPPEVVVPGVVWLAKQDAASFTGRVVRRAEFGTTWP